MKKIFRVFAEESRGLETLVVAKDINEAKMLTLMGLKNGELVFDGYGAKEHSVTSVYPETITNKTDKEINDYGILNQQAELEYGSEILDDLVRYQKQQEKEKVLKKNHMEFDFGKN